MALYAFIGLVALGVAVGIILFACCDPSPETEADWLDRQL